MAKGNYLIPIVTVAVVAIFALGIFNLTTDCYQVSIGVQKRALVCEVRR